MIRTYIILFFFFCLIISSCDSNRVYEKNMEMDNKTWLADSILGFTFNVNDTTDRYNIYYNLRNTKGYPFQNIYVTYTLEDSLGTQLSQELVNKELFNAKTGQPYGEGGIGGVYDHKFLLMEDFQFHQSGAYLLKLQQFMRRDSLPEILSIGVRVEKAPHEEK